MAEETLADLFLAAGVRGQQRPRPLSMRPAWQRTPEANTPYRAPQQALADRNTLPYLRQETRNERRQQNDLAQFALEHEAARNEVNTPPGTYLGQDALEMTGLPSVARGIGHLRDGEPGQALPEVALGGLGVLGMVAGGGARTPRARPPMRAALPEIPAEAPRLPNAPARLPGRATDGSVLPIRPPQPIRQSMVGGSDDLAEAAAMRPQVQGDPEALSLARSWIDTFGGGPEAEARAISVMEQHAREATHPLRRQLLEEAVASVRSRQYVRGEPNTFSARVEEAWPEIYGSRSGPDARPTQAGRVTGASTGYLSPRETAARDVIRSRPDISNEELSAALGMDDPRAAGIIRTRVEQKTGAQASSGERVRLVDMVRDQNLRMQRGQAAEVSHMSWDENTPMTMYQFPGDALTNVRITQRSDGVREVVFSARGLKQGSASRADIESVFGDALAAMERHAATNQGGRYFFEGETPAITRLHSLLLRNANLPDGVSVRPVGAGIEVTFGRTAPDGRPVQAGRDPGTYRDLDLGDGNVVNFRAVESDPMHREIHWDISDVRGYGDDVEALAQQERDIRRRLDFTPGLRSTEEGQALQRQVSEIAARRREAQVSDGAGSKSYVHAFRAVERALNEELSANAGRGVTYEFYPDKAGLQPIYEAWARRFQHPDYRIEKAEVGYRLVPTNSSRAGPNAGPPPRPRPPPRRTQ